jgi:hypothetical protein
MQQHLKILINLLIANNFKAALQHYIDSSEAENVAQLAFTFQQGNKKLANFDVYQQTATKFIKAKVLPTTLIARIKTHDTLSFFTPALQFEHNFSKTNDQQRNVLHYLLTVSLLTGSLLVDNSTKENSAKVNKVQPPFNYLRSLMLFESNEPLCAALCQRDSQNLTPVESYLFTHSNLTDLPDHELSALFALIEIECKQQAIDDANYRRVLSAVIKLCNEQKISMSSELQRLILIATYYKKPLKQVIKDMN